MDDTTTPGLLAFFPFYMNPHPLPLPYDGRGQGVGSVISCHGHPPLAAAQHAVGRSGRRAINRAVNRKMSHQPFRHECMSPSSQITHARGFPFCIPAYRHVFRSAARRGDRYTHRRHIALRRRWPKRLSPLLLCIFALLPRLMMKAWQYRLGVMRCLTLWNSRKEW